ncbi:MAG TPA: hypothetical protein VJ741_09700 [Solirubrobacteraceae bacterium]|nr:hypothetical protein [Solirubrobacteraceae bacterium]
MPASNTSTGDEAAVAPRIPWAQHRAWLDHHWEAGMHVSGVVQTGGGKSYLTRYGLLPLWTDYRTLYFDVKGDDPTLAGLGRPVREFPDEERGSGPQDDESRIYRLLVPEWEFDASRRSTGGLERARRVAGGALDRAYKQGDWLLVLDETRAFTDTANEFGLGLRGVVENIWQRGRSRRVTLIALTQQPVWMPSSFYSQCTLMYVGAEVDLSNEHMRDIGGDRDALRRAVSELREHEFVAIYRRPPRQMWITKVAA